MYIICPTCGENYTIYNNNEKLLECPNGHQIINEIDKLRKKIDKLKKNINKIINIFKEIIDNIEKYYENHKIFIENNKNNNINNKLIQNIKVMNRKNTIKYINQIKNNENIISQFSEILKIYNKFKSIIT